MPLRTIFAILLSLAISGVMAQGLNCATSDPFCTGTIYDFPAGTSGSAETGPYYGCLSSQPAPAWYHMKIANPGPITIYMHSEPHRDIDFACWGPFTDPETPCPTGLTQSKMIDCCYCTSWEEYCDIPNGQTGEYYIMLITNFSQQPCNIIFSQTAGSGSTDCTILPPLVSSDSPLCVGDTLHLYAETISNATYAWTGPGGFSSSIQNPVIPDVTLANAGDYACVITIYGSTSPPAVTPVVVNPLPDAALMQPNMTVCPGDEAFMLVQLTGSGPFEIIYYDGAAFITASDLSGPVDTIFVSPPGPATYSLTQVSDTNCTKSLSGIVFQVLNYPPATGWMSGGEVICPGDTAELVFNLTGTPPWEITYLTNGMNPQTVMADITPFTIEVYPLVTTYYAFTELADAYCEGTASGQVEISVDYPSGQLSGDQEICFGEGAHLIFILTGYPPWLITYSANGVDQPVVTATYSPYSIAVSPTETTYYEFTSLLDDFCSGTVNGQALITVQRPTGELTGAATICNGASATIAFSLNGNPPWTCTYTANGASADTFLAYSSPHLVTLSPDITTVYDFTYFEDADCEGIPSGQAMITVNPLPVANAGTDQTIPNGTSTILEGTVSGGSGSYIFQWEPAALLVNPGTLQPMTVNLFSSTVFTLNITDQNGQCIGTDAVQVTVAGGVLSCGATADPAVICFGETSQLTALASGGSGNYTYAWSSDPPGFGSNLPNPVVNPETETDYYVVVNDGYNIAQASAAVNVNPLPLPDAGDDLVITFGTVAQLHANATGGSGNYAFRWEPAYLLNNPDIADPVTVNLTTTTLFTLSVTDLETGCQGDGYDVVAVMISGSALTANPVAEPSVICAGEVVQLHCLAGGGTGAYTYAWSSTPPGFISDEADPVVTPLECCVYHVTVSDGFNSIEGSVGITVHPNPYVDLGPDTTVCVFDTIMIDAGNPGASYLWSNGATGRSISIGSTGIGYEQQSVQVQVISPEGCVTMDQKTVAFDFIACSAIEESKVGSNFILYPNPGKGSIHLENLGDFGRYYLTITGSHGQAILRDLPMIFSQANPQFTLNISLYGPGVYFLNIRQDKGLGSTFRYIFLP